MQSPLEFFRRIILDVTATQCRVAMEDEYHYFVLNLGHDGERITSVDSTSLRTPWTICPQAAGLLQAFVGQKMRQRIPVSLPEIDIKQQCTHQYDLLILALTHANRPGRREYQAKITGALHETRHAELWLNDDKLLDWWLQGTSIHSNDEFDQQNLRSIMPWAQETLGDQQLEALFVQRRAVMVASGKGVNLDLIKNAGEIMDMRGGGCFAFQPERAEQAGRIVGNVREDVTGPEDLLAELDHM